MVKKFNTLINKTIERAAKKSYNPIERCEFSLITSIKRDVFMKKVICLFFAFLFSSVCACTQSKADSSGSSPVDSSSLSPDIESSVSFDYDECSIGVGVSKTLDISFENVEIVSFRSSDESVVSVADDGTVTGVKIGKAEVMVTATSDPDGEELSDVTTVYVNPEGYDELSGNERAVKWLGRTFYAQGAVNCYDTASGFEVRFYGTKLSAKIISAGNKTPQICVAVDGQKIMSASVIDLSKTRAERDYVLAENLDEGIHVVRVYKITEPFTSSMGVKKIVSDGYLINTPKTNKLKIEVYGDSITTGHNNLRETAAEAEDTADKIQNGCLTYAFLTAQNLKAEISVHARVGIGMYSAWGYSFVFKNNWKKTYLSENDFLYNGINPEWDFKKYIPDVVVINIGTNDVWFNWNETQYKTDMKKICDELFTLYGDNLKIVLVGGMMTSDNMPAMKAVAQEYFDGKVTTVTLPMSVANHPRVSDNENAAKTLTAYLKKTLSIK